MDDDFAQHRPIEIQQCGPRSLEIRWSGGQESQYEVRQLRLACSCAHCVDEWSGEKRLDTTSVPDDVHPLKVQPVGRYAIQIDWSDGHSTGIYSFRQLRRLADEMENTPPR